MNGAPDQLRLSLGAWWRENGLGQVPDLTDQQARAALDEIERMQWECRPFTPDQA